MHYPKNFDRHLIKRIEVEQKFADNVYKEFRAKRYGLAACCSLDQMDKYKIKKELCDWNDLKLKTYSSTTYEELNFYPIPENNPNLFDTTTTTTETTTPITTYETTITVQGDPIWVVDDCKNNCVYPVTFKPTDAQLFNVGDNTGLGGISDSVDIETGLVFNTGVLSEQLSANAAVKLNPFDLLNIPNNSGNAEVTFYAPINAQAIFAYYTNDTSLPMESLTNPMVTDNLNFPPDLFATEYYVPVSQFTLIPGIADDGTPIYTAAYRYKDPGLDVIGNGTSQEVLVNGETMFKNDVDQDIAPTFFGNTKSFQVSLGTSNNFYNLNGGLFYGTNNSFYQMRIVVKDGLDVYYIDPLVGGEGLNLNFPNPDVYYYANENISGNFTGTETFWLQVPVLFEQDVMQEQFKETSCSFNWGIGTISNSENIGLNGNIIESGTLNTKCTYLGIETLKKK